MSTESSSSESKNIRATKTYIGKSENPSDSEGVFDLRTKKKVNINMDDSLEFSEEEKSVLLQASSRITNWQIWTRIFTIGLLGLLFLYLGTRLYLFVNELLVQTTTLGIIGYIFFSLVILGLIGISIREWVAILSLKKIDKLRRKFESAQHDENLSDTRESVKKLIAMYSDHANSQRIRKKMQKYLNEIVSSSELIEYTEENLLIPLDKNVQKLILGSALKISILTTANSRITIEFLIVLAENLRLIRKIMAIYGGRPSISSSYRLARIVMANIATAVGVEHGTSMLANVFGQGLLSTVARVFGAGLINGLLTIRIGLVAQDVCRPCPFTSNSKPNLKNLTKSFINSISSREEIDEKSGKTEDGGLNEYNNEENFGN